MLSVTDILMGDIVHRDFIHSQPTAAQNKKNSSLLVFMLNKMNSVKSKNGQ